jgi:hypothetical protein
LSIIYIPNDEHASDRATLIDLLSEVETFFSQLVTSGEDSTGKPIFVPYLHGVLLAAWNGNLDIKATSTAERFEFAREMVANTTDEDLTAKGLKGKALQSKLLKLMESADVYNELGGRQAIQDLFARLEVLLVAASLEDILKMKRLIWSSIAHEDGASDSDELRIYH